MSTNAIAAYPPHEVSPLEKLPLDILLNIIPYLHPGALCSAVNTCRTLYNKLQPSLYHTVEIAADKQSRDLSSGGDKFSSPNIDSLFQSACLRNELSKFKWVRILGVTEGLLCATPFRDCPVSVGAEGGKHPRLVAFQRALPYMTSVHTLRVSVDAVSSEGIELNQCVETFRHIIANLPSLRSIEVSAQLFDFLPAICAAEEVKSGLITSISAIPSWSDSNSDEDKFYDVLEKHAKSLRSLHITFPCEDSDYWPEKLDESRLPLGKLKSIELYGGLFVVPRNVVSYTHQDCAPPPEEFEELSNSTALQKLKIQGSYQYPQEHFIKTYIPADINFHNLTVLELYDPRSSEWLGHDPADVQLLPRGYLHSVVAANPYLREITCPCISDKTLHVLAQPTRALYLEELYVHFPHSGDIETPYTATGITALSACPRLKKLRFNIGNVRLCPELLEPLVNGNDRLEKLLVFHGLYQEKVINTSAGETADAWEQRKKAATRAIIEARFEDMFVPGCNNGKWPPKEGVRWITSMNYSTDERDNGKNGYLIDIAKLKVEMRWTVG